MHVKKRRRKGKKTCKTCIIRRGKKRARRKRGGETCKPCKIRGKNFLYKRRWGRVKRA